MKIAIADIEDLRENIKVIREYANEGIIVVDKEKLTITVQDPANVTLIHLDFLSSGCTEWDVKEKTEFGIDFSNLYEILKIVDKDSIVVFTIGDKKLIIEEKNRSTTTYKIPTIKIEEKIKIPDLNFESCVNIDYKNFKSIINKIDKICESVTFETTNNSFIISAENEIGSSISSEIKQDDDNRLKINKESKVKYGIEYLNKLLKFNNNLVKTIELQFSTDYPLSASFTKVDRFRLNVIQAPRVETG